MDTLLQIGEFIIAIIIGFNVININKIKARLDKLEK